MKAQKNNPPAIAEVRVRGTGWTGWAAIWLGLFTAFGLQVLSTPVVLVLKNGDRVTGELTDENPERLVVKSELLGKLKIPTAQVVRREPWVTPSPAPLTKPVATNLPASATAKAGTTPSASPSSSSSSSSSATFKGPVTNAPVIAQYSLWDPRHYFPGWMRPLGTNWHGNVQLGMDLGFGTTDRKTFYANAAVNHSYDRFRNNLTYRAAYGTAESLPGTPSRGAVLTADSMEGLWKTDFDLGVKRRIYLYHQAGAGYDEIRRYHLRYEDGLGVGYKLIDRPKLNINLETGVQYQHLTYKNGPTLLPALPDSDVWSVRFGENLTWKPSEKLRITQRIQITPNVQDTSEFRVRFELGLSYPLFKRVTLNFNVFDEYDSRPATFVENNQLQVQSTVGLTF